MYFWLLLNMSWPPHPILWSISVFKCADITLIEELTSCISYAEMSAVDISGPLAWTIMPVLLHLMLSYVCNLKLSEAKVYGIFLTVCKETSIINFILLCPYLAVHYYYLEVFYCECENCVIYINQLNNILQNIPAFLSSIVGLNMPIKQYINPVYWNKKAQVNGTLFPTGFVLINVLGQASLC